MSENKQHHHLLRTESSSSTSSSNSPIENVNTGLFNKGIITDKELLEIKFYLMNGNLDGKIISSILNFEEELSLDRINISIKHLDWWVREGSVASSVADEFCDCLLHITFESRSFVKVKKIIETVSECKHIRISCLKRVIETCIREKKAEALEVMLNTASTINSANISGCNSSHCDLALSLKHSENKLMLLKTDIAMLGITAATFGESRISLLLVSWICKMCSLSEQERILCQMLLRASEHGHTGLCITLLNVLRDNGFYDGDSSQNLAKGILKRCAAAATRNGHLETLLTFIVFYGPAEVEVLKVFELAATKGHSHIVEAVQNLPIASIKMRDVSELLQYFARYDILPGIKTLINVFLKRFRENEIIHARDDAKSHGFTKVARFLEELLNDPKIIFDKEKPIPNLSPLKQNVSSVNYLFNSSKVFGKVGNIDGDSNNSMLVNICWNTFDTSLMTRICKFLSSRDIISLTSCCKMLRLLEPKVIDILAESFYQEFAKIWLDATNVQHDADPTKVESSMQKAANFCERLTNIKPSSSASQKICRISTISKILNLTNENLVECVGLLVASSLGHDSSIVAGPLISGCATVLTGSDRTNCFESGLFGAIEFDAEHILRAIVRTSAFRPNFAKPFISTGVLLNSIVICAKKNKAKLAGILLGLLEEEAKNNVRLVLNYGEKNFITTTVFGKLIGQALVEVAEVGCIEIFNLLLNHALFLTMAGVQLRLGHIQLALENAIKCNHISIAESFLNFFKLLLLKKSQIPVESILIREHSSLTADVLTKSVHFGNVEICRMLMNYVDDSVSILRRALLHETRAGNVEPIRLILLLLPNEVDTTDAIHAAYREANARNFTLIQETILQVSGIRPPRLSFSHVMPQSSNLEFHSTKSFEGIKQTRPASKSVDHKGVEISYFATDSNIHSTDPVQQDDIQIAAAAAAEEEEEERGGQGEAEGILEYRTNNNDSLMKTLFLHLHDDNLEHITKYLDFHSVSRLSLVCKVLKGRRREREQLINSLVQDYMDYRREGFDSYHFEMPEFLSRLVLPNPPNSSLLSSFADKIVKNNLNNELASTTSKTSEGSISQQLKKAVDGSNTMFTPYAHDICSSALSILLEKMKNESWPDAKTLYAGVGIVAARAGNDAVLEKVVWCSEGCSSLEPMISNEHISVIFETACRVGHHGIVKLLLRLLNSSDSTLTSPSGGSRLSSQVVLNQLRDAAQRNDATMVSAMLLVILREISEAVKPTTLFARAGGVQEWGPLHHQPAAAAAAVGADGGGGVDNQQQLLQQQQQQQQNNPEGVILNHTAANAASAAQPLRIGSANGMSPRSAAVNVQGNNPNSGGGSGGSSIDQHHLLTIAQKEMIEAWARSNQAYVLGTTITSASENAKAAGLVKSILAMARARGLLSEVTFGRRVASALVQCCREGYIQSIKYLLNGGPQIQPFLSDIALEAFQTAARNGRAEVCLLLAESELVDVSNLRQMFMDSVRRNHEFATTVLLQIPGIVTARFAMVAMEECKTRHYDDLYSLIEKEYEKLVILEEETDKLKLSGGTSLSSNLLS